jgi:hypothetical protein
LSDGLELYDSRVSRIEILDGVAAIYFSHAYIHKTKGKPGRDGGTGWSQEARLVLADVSGQQPLPLPLPNTIAEGYLEVGGIRHEILPLPFKRKVDATLFLAFVDGTELMLTGSRPYIELLGSPILLEDYS